MSHGRKYEFRSLPDFLTEVAKGNVWGHSILSAIGERESIGTTASGEDITRMNELSPAPTSHVKVPTPADAGELMTVVSESQADNGTSATGALTVRVHYLDPTGVAMSTDVTLDGTTPVDIPAILMRFVQDFYVLTVGSVGVSVGNLKIYKTGTAGLVYNMIAAGGNKSLIPIRMVPFGHSLILKGFHATEAQAKRCAFRLRSTDMNGELLAGIFCFKDVSYLRSSASGELAQFDLVPALSIIKVSGWAVVSGSEGSTHWWGLLIEDNYLEGSIKHK